jgi:hypothetical protein
MGERDMRSTCLTRLARVEAQERQHEKPRQTVTLQIVYYDASGLHPDELGESYVYYVPDTGPAWRADPC